MSNQNWNAAAYSVHASFVPEQGRALIEMLAPSEGMSVLDLGCGDGELTKELLDAGCEVMGVDASPDMVEAARANGIDVRLLDAQEMDFDREFDAVFSNAALHWMSDQYAVVRAVWRALVPGGRFVAECGGDGCLRVIREGIKSALAKRDVDYKSRNPWHFPEVGLYTKILENQGFSVRYIARIDRPTKLEHGLRAWLEVFTASHTRGFSDAERASFYDDVEKYCRPRLFSEKDGWIADYVRMRFDAVKPLD